MPYPRITVPELGLHDLWLDLMRLADELPGQWTVIGAYMVALHAWGSGIQPPRRSDEADVLVNLRLPDVTAKMVADRLLEIGYVPVERNRMGTVHRFDRGSLSLDVFGPESVGRRSAAKLDTGMGRMLQVPGGTQALLRSEPQDIQSQGVQGQVPLPSLLAAGLLKSRAYFKRNNDLTREADLQDLAFVLGVAAETATPDQWLAEFAGQQRNWLRKAAEPLLASRSAWTAAERPDRARRFLEVLL